MFVDHGADRCEQHPIDIDLPAGGGYGPKKIGSAYAKLSQKLKTLGSFPIHFALILLFCLSLFFIKTFC